MASDYHDLLTYLQVTVKLHFLQQEPLINSIIALSAAFNEMSTCYLYGNGCTGIWSEAYNSIFSGVNNTFKVRMNQL